MPVSPDVSAPGGAAIAAGRRTQLRLHADALLERAERAGHHTTQAIAQYAGVGRSSLSRSMAGRTTPATDTLYRLGRAYGLPMEDLLLEQEDAP